MAQFYGEMQGNRGEASRMGTKNSGFSAHIRGWNIGVSVVCEHNQKTGKDEIHVYKTSGSSGNKASKLLAILIEGE